MVEASRAERRGGGPLEATAAGEARSGDMYLVRTDDGERSQGAGDEPRCRAKKARLPCRRHAPAAARRPQTLSSA